MTSHQPITLQDLADDDWLRGYTQMLFTAESHEEVFLSVKHLLAVQSGALQRLAELAEDGERWREYLSHHAVEQRAEVIAAIDAARADEVGEPQNEILRRIGDRGLSLAQKGIGKEHLDLWQHLLDEVQRLSSRPAIIEEWHSGKLEHIPEYFAKPRIVEDLAAAHPVLIVRQMANEILRLRAAPSLSRDGLDWERADEVLSSAIKCLSSEWGPSWNTPDGIAVLEALRAKVREAGKS